MDGLAHILFLLVLMV